MKNNIIQETIKAAIEPTRNQAISTVQEMIKKRVENTYAKFALHDWDLRLAFPVKYNSWDYKISQEAERFARSYSKRKGEWGDRMNSPKPSIALSESEIEAKTLKEATEHVDQLFVSYITKLSSKVEKFAEGKEIQSCEYKGGFNLWSHSIIKVNLSNGETFDLKTQIIVNCSKLGTLFNQFPTRKMK